MKPILFLDLLLLETDLLLELGILDDLVQSRRNLRVQHLEISKNPVLELIAEQLVTCVFNRISYQKRLWSRGFAISRFAVFAVRQCNLSVLPPVL